MRKSHAIALFGVWIVFSATISAELFLEGRSSSGAGVAIITSIFVFFFVMSSIPTKEIRITKPAAQIKVDEQIDGAGEGLITLISAKNFAEAKLIEQKLKNEGIDCILFDEQGSTMMGFLPDVEIRIMIKREDLGNSQKITSQ